MKPVKVRKLLELLEGVDPESTFEVTKFFNRDAIFITKDINLDKFERKVIWIDKYFKDVDEYGYEIENDDTEESGDE